MTRRILHLGLGAFHRAHQAVYLQKLHDAGDRSWMLASGNIRPDDEALVAALARSGGAYTLETVSPSGERKHETIRSIGEVLPWDEDLRRVVETGADPAIAIISFTVTEAGYAPDAPLYRALAAILRARMHAGVGPVTLLSCDNLRHNGGRSRAGLLDFLHACGDDALAEWVERNTSSPDTMVDRITPRPLRDDPDALMSETFLQWVIEDRFIAGRPAWERVGAQLVDNVAPYEEAKIRLLNATHSCLAWAGTLAGLRFIHEDARDPRIHRLAWEYVTHDAIPALGASPIALPAYRDTVLERFANRALPDTNQRVASDSFAKIPTFILPTLHDRLASGDSIASAAMLPALFLAFLQRWHRGLLPFEHSDQAMDAAVAHAVCDAADPVAALCDVAALWGPLRGNALLVAAVRDASARVAMLFP